MTEYAEVIYENGEHSIVSVEDREELKSALSEQHRRAMAGEPSGPAGEQAQRVKRVLMYDEHPADYFDTTVDAKTLNTLVEGMANKKGRVSEAQMVQALRDETSPVYPVDQGSHESIYKQKENEELKMDFLPKDAS